jgi:hypothetical protein
MMTRGMKMMTQGMKMMTQEMKMMTRELEAEVDGGGGGGGGGVEYHWEVKNFKEITTGQPFKSINNASVNDCRNKCEKKNKCVGFNIGPIVGTKTCILYSGMDVRTEYDMNKNTHLLSRV